MTKKNTGENIQNVITHIEEMWKSYAPDTPFEYSILTSRFNEMYVNLCLTTGCYTMEEANFL